ncbi:hypothetical protein [Microbacterium rhizosphaerae]|uniref:Type II toxin-antitoxin system HicB family antitoxin n=1 Tax=Microbacterium rhizosphaerae TaxID=1678237 RepID=A0ABZ0SQ85_9MICO|nr:hypothetical protein [Microbacterium rhizosphaerae]WPR91328.1 hypothetical protein SM116_08645 [Microbacterium rhizosphaerae]
MDAYATKCYDITVERNGDVWRIEIPELGASTTADSLEHVVRVAQRFIATDRGVPLTSFIVQITRLVE